MAREANAVRSGVRRMLEDDAGKGGGSFFNLPEGAELWEGPTKTGMYLIDIIPYEVSISNHQYVQKGDLWGQKKFFIHSGIGPGKGRPYVCPRTVNKRCPICEHKEELEKQGEDEKIIKALKLHAKELFNIDVGAIVNKEFAPMLWATSMGNFGKLLRKELTTMSEEHSGFFLLSNGFTIKTEFEEKSFMGHKFFEAWKMNFVSREPYTDSILKHTVDLDTVLNILPYDELKAIFLGIDDVSEIESGKPVAEPEDHVFDVDREHRRERVRGSSVEENKPTIAEEAPARRRRTVKEEPKEEPKEKNTFDCPHGHKFGADTEMTQDCSACDTDTWEACTKEKAKNTQPSSRRKD